MKQKTIEIAKKKYPGWKLRYTKPVCYSYPKEGVMLTLVEPVVKKRKISYNRHMHFFSGSTKATYKGRRIWSVVIIR